MGTPIFDAVVERYEQETEYSKHLDQKASNQIGFVGIITAIVSIIIGSNGITSIKNVDHTWLTLGISLLLISIIIGIIVLTPFTKRRQVFDIEPFNNDFGNETDDVQRKYMIQIYLWMSRSMYQRNNTKALMLYVGNGFTIAGLVITFISFLTVLQNT